MANRISELLRAKNGGNQSEVARYIGVSPQAVQQWVTGETAPRGNNLIKLADFLGVSRSYLQFGEESKNPIEAIAYAPTMETHRYVAREEAVGYGVNIINIPKSDAVASMGHGNPMPEHESLADYVRVNRAWVQSNFPGVNPAKLAALSAYGDSMEPTFSDGDTLIVDRGVLSIKIDAVYVLSLNDELFIKRLQRRPDGIMMISDNKNYQPYLIHNGEREKFAVLGRVIWAWNGRKI